MEIGENGARGTNAVRRVSKANNYGAGNVIHQHLSMAERRVMENLTRQLPVTRMYLVQVRRKNTTF